MFGNLRENLSKNQKMGIFVAFQVFLIMIVIFLFSMRVGEVKEEVKLDYSDDDISKLEDVPKKEQEEIRSGIFDFLVSRFADKNINDMNIVVRGDSVDITMANGGDNLVKFIFDIDELQQTYVVEYIWRNDKTVLPDPLTVSCPKKSEMKYQETFCQSRYNNTDSPELYLPYTFSDTERRGNFTISWEQEKIKAFIAVCDAENQKKYREKVDEYLATTPIDLNKYKVEYQFECYSD